MKKLISVIAALVLLFALGPPALADYDPEADLENTPDSVFCAHGGGTWMPR